MIDLTTMAEAEIRDLIAAAQAELARRAPAEPELRRILLRQKDLNARGNGTQETRRIRLPDGAAGWASDLAQDVTGDWSSGTLRADDRRCSQHGHVPVGTIVLAFDSSFRGGQKHGPASVVGGVVVSTAQGVAVRKERTGKDDGKSDAIRWGLSTRRRNGDYEVQTPDGEWVTV